MQTNNDLQGAYVRYFADDAADSAARSLQFLRVIESTIDALRADTNKYDSMARIGQELAERLRNHPIQRPIDTEGAIEGALESGVAAMSSIMERLKKGREAAAADADLFPEDGVVDAYDGLIEALRRSHDVLCDVLWALTEHDIDQSEPSPDVYKTVDDLFTALKI